MSRKKMEQVMFDVYVAEATMDADYQSFNTPEKKEAYINKIFAKHNTTQAVWDTSLSWYSDRIDLYLQINDSVKSRLKRKHASLDAEQSRQSLQLTQSNEMIYSASYIPPVYIFNMPGNDRGGFRFRLDSSTLAKDISEDEFEFRYSVFGVPSDFNLNFHSLLTLEYSDTTIYRQEKITENREYITTVNKYITDDTLSQVRGYVKLQSKGGFIPDIQLYNISIGNRNEAELLTTAPDSLQLLPMEMSR